MNTPNKKIPILFFLHYLKGFGGTERYLFEVIKRLDRDKYIPFICCFQLKEVMREVFKAQGVPVTEFPMQRIYGFQAVRYGKKLIDFIKEEKIKIIQSFHLLPDIFVPIVAKIASVPIIISSRRDMGFDKNKYHLFLQRRINVLVDKIMVNSDAVKNSVINNENVSSSKIEKIYNGIDIVNQKNVSSIKVLKKKLNIKLSDFIVGILAHHNRSIKGGIFFISACLKILKQVPNTKFLVVGGGNLIEELKENAKSLGIAEQVIFTGPVLDARDYLSMMDVSVNSSLSEGFSNTILESMASGVPVVATNVGGNPEAIMNGKTGFLVPPANDSAIADAVVRILKDKKLTKSMGLCAKKHVEENFSMEKMMARVENFYDSLMTGDTNSRSELC